MDVNFQELEELCFSGDFGGYISKPQLFTKLWRGRDRYVSQSTGFSWSHAVESEAAALVFLGAASDVYRYDSARTLPADAEHMSVLLGEESSITNIIDRDSTGSTDQLIVTLPDYHRKLSLPPNEAHIYPDETWLQKGNKETPIHMDHGRVLAYIPPCATRCFTVWVFFDHPTLAKDFNVKYKVDSLNRMLEHPRSSVLIQRPGDVVYVNSLVYHSVRVGYLEDTPESEKWAAISGCVVIRYADMYESYQFATQVGGGSRKGSRQAWQSILSAYCVMEGREWLDENYEKERQQFLAALPRSTLSSATSTSAQAKWTKKRKRDELMKKVRAQRKNKSNSGSE